MTAAARLRGVSRPAIGDLVRRGRLHSYQIGETGMASASGVISEMGSRQQMVSLGR